MAGKMFKKVFLLLIISLELISGTLKETYFVKSNDINISQIIPQAKKNVKLYTIDDDRYSKRVRSKDLVKLLGKYGYGPYKTSSMYITFMKKSNIDTTKMELALKKLYKDAYSDIEINSINIIPRGYISSLKKDYIVGTRKRDVLHRKGVIYAKTTDNKKIFFDYFVDAKVSIYIAKRDIDKSERLSLLNTTKKRVTLDKFRAMPMQEGDLNVKQSKYNIRKDRIITTRDIETLTLVKRGSRVNVTLDNSGILITFGAEALQNGKLNDIITVKNNKGKRFQVKVLGRNRVEIKQ